MVSLQARGVRKTVARRFVERTLRGERLGLEAYAWVTQRITGLILLGFLIVHLYTLSSILGGEVTYNQTMKALESPFIKIGELLLIWVILFHSFNGFRLIMYNLFPALNHKRLAYSAYLVSLLLFFISIPLIL